MSLELKWLVLVPNRVPIKMLGSRYWPCACLSDFNEMENTAGQGVWHRPVDGADGRELSPPMVWGQRGPAFASPSPGSASIAITELSPFSRNAAQLLLGQPRCSFKGPEPLTAPLSDLHAVFIQPHSVQDESSQTATMCSFQIDFSMALEKNLSETQLKKLKIVCGGRGQGITKH